MTQPSDPQYISTGAILFDMDGTLIDSTPGVLKAWRTFAKDYALGDSLAIAHETHGRRLYDTLREYCKIEDEALLLKEIERFEDEVISGGPIALPGALGLLNRLDDIEGKWTIVTSASRKFALSALNRAGLPVPGVGIVTSGDVTRGKPHPDPYEAGAALCGIPASSCLVVEDAVSGILAGKAAGAKTLAVLTSTTRERLLPAEPDAIISNLMRVSVDSTDGQLTVEIAETTT